MTNQEIFDKVKAHLLTQGRKSQVDGKCQYFGPDGAMCAVGCLLDPSRFELVANSSHISSHHVMDNLKRNGIDVYGGDDTLNLLSTLQNLHDCVNPAFWEEDLALIRDRFGLT